MFVCPDCHAFAHHETARMVFDDAPARHLLQRFARKDRSRAFIICSFTHPGRGSYGDIDYPLATKGSRRGSPRSTPSGSLVEYCFSSTPDRAQSTQKPRRRDDAESAPRGQFFLSFLHTEVFPRCFVLLRVYWVCAWGRQHCLSVWENPVGQRLSQAAR